MILYVICQLVCVIDSWAHTSFGTFNFILKIGCDKYGAFNDTAMGEAEEEVVAEDEPADDLGQAIRDTQRECESKKDQVQAHARGS